MSTAIDNLPKTKILNIPPLELELDEYGDMFNKGKGMYRVAPESMADLQKVLLDANVSHLLSYNVSLNTLESTLEYGWKWIEQTCGGLKGINEKREHWTELLKKEPGNYTSRFCLRWLSHLEDHLYGGGSLEELFRRVMSTDEMKRLLRMAAKQSGKDLDESQLNLLASNQDLAKAYVKPILDAIQAQQTQSKPQQTTQPQLDPQQTLTPLERLAEQMLNLDAIQQRIRKSMPMKVSDKAFESLLKDPQFRKTCITDIVTGILNSKTEQTVKSNEAKLDNLINPAPESQPAPETEAQQQAAQTQTQTQPDQDQQTQSQS